MSASWTQYSVQCSDGEMSDYIYDSLWSAEQELKHIQEILDNSDPQLEGITAWIVEREVEAGEWERKQ